MRGHLVNRVATALVAMLISASCGSDGAVTTEPSADSNGGSDLSQAGDPAEAPVEDDDCSLLSGEEIESEVGIAPTSHEVPPIGSTCLWLDEDGSIILALEIADDAVSVDGEPSSRFDRIVERHEASSIAQTLVDGLGDQAVLAGEPIPNSAAVRAGDTFVEIIVNEMDLLEADSVERLVRLVLDRL